MCVFVNGGGGWACWRETEMDDEKVIHLSARVSCRSPVFYRINYGVEGRKVVMKSCWQCLDAIYMNSDLW